MKVYVLSVREWEIDSIHYSWRVRSVHATYQSAAKAALELRDVAGADKTIEEHEVTNE